MKLQDILSTGSVSYNAGITNKKRLIHRIAEKSEQLYGLDHDIVAAALLDREALGSTGVGSGVAIPHARFEALECVVGLFMRLDKPIDFESVDRQPVDLIFTLLAPQKEGAEHLKALALVSRTLRSSETCKVLRSSHSDDSLFAILTDSSQFVAA